MSDDYRCFRCQFFNRSTHTCKSKIGCIETSDPDDFEVGGTDIFERSPECEKTRREHFRDLSDRDLAMYIAMYVQNKCRFCEKQNDCTRTTIEFCTEGIVKWLTRRIGIYD